MSTPSTDVLVIGSGIGGLCAAGLLARQGYRVRVLESNYLPGGCCSSYWRKNYVFETGATTFVGLDAHQPLRYVADALQLQLPLERLDPAMAVHLDGERITRWHDRDAWMDEAGRAFGNERAQQRFWQNLFRLSDFVWQASTRNRRFPPQTFADWPRLLLNNDPRDLPKLRWALRSTMSMLRDRGLDRDARFRRFVDEQLMITAQAPAAKTPALFAAPALCYTNSNNYYLHGGMIQLPAALIAALGRQGGELFLRKKVTALREDGDGYLAETAHGDVHRARAVLSNLPLWNLPALTEGRARRYFAKQAARLPGYWGAITMGIAVADHLPSDLPLHHQIHLSDGEAFPHGGGRSLFVSISARGDTGRAPAGERVLALSTHAAEPGRWFAMDRQAYARAKDALREAILSTLFNNLPGLARAHLRYDTISTPRSWQQWIEREEGNVGGVPQGMDRPVFSWQGALTPFRHFYLCGDTVYPGQGIPGAALGGLIAAERISRALPLVDTPAS